MSRIRYYVKTRRYAIDTYERIFLLNIDIPRVSAICPDEYKIVMGIVYEEWQWFLDCNSDIQITGYATNGEFVFCFRSDVGYLNGTVLLKFQDLDLRTRSVVQRIRRKIRDYRVTQDLAPSEPLPRNVFDVSKLGLDYLYQTGAIAQNDRILSMALRYHGIK